MSGGMKCYGSVKIASAKAYRSISGIINISSVIKRRHIGARDGGTHQQLWQQNDISGK